MARGRKPLPTHLKLIKGNPGRRPLNEDEPEAPYERPACPGHVSDKARETWGYVCGLLEGMGIISTVDAIAIEVLCEAYADFLAAGEELKSLGSPYYRTKTESGAVMHRAHPAQAARRDADARVRAWLSEFGMTPAQRSKIKLGSPKKSEDPAEKFFA